MSKLLKIWCYDTESGSLYQMYEEEVPEAYSTSERIVDAKAYAENGVDNLYFTDNYYEVRQLRCEIPDPFVENFLTEEQLSLQRRGASGSVRMTDIVAGGTLLTGSYQFAYRMVDPETKKFTKWSSLTNPIHVYNDELIQGNASQEIAGYITATASGLTNDTTLNCRGNYDLLQTITVFLKDEDGNPLLAPSNIFIDFEATFEDANGSFSNPFTVVILAGNSEGSESYARTGWYEDPIFGCTRFTNEVLYTQEPSSISSADGAFYAFGTPDSVNLPSRATAGIGIFSNKKIQLQITPSASEVANFNFFQLAVIDNVAPTSLITTTANLLAIEPFTDPSTAYEYKSNNKIDTIPIEDIVVDLAAVETAKTLNIKQNRLFIGNIKYHGLEPDNGTPSVTGEVLAEAVDYNIDKESSRKVGYFRDEVYRYAVVYSDKYGNKGTPIALDMRDVTGNQSGAFPSGFKDMKFPARNLDGAYSLLTNTSLPRALRLRLFLTNHPTWAVSFEIVRVKRRKRIQFQTPVIPFASVKGTGARSNYPSKIRTKVDDSTSSDNEDFPDAQPMTPDEVYVPKNFMWAEFRDVIENQTSTNSAPNSKSKGEARLMPRYENTGSGAVSRYDLCGIFPPESMYADVPYNFKGSESLDTVDFTLCKLNISPFGPADTGDNLETQVSANVYAVEDKEYFFDSTSSSKSLPATNSERVTAHVSKISNYRFFDNLDQGADVAGKPVMKYSLLNTVGGPVWGYTPSVNKMAVVSLDSLFDDNHALTFAAGTKNRYNPNTAGPVVGASGVAYKTIANISNDMFGSNGNTRYTNYTPESYVHALRIVNVVDDKIGDLRYGDSDDQHEYISTGAVYTFTEEQIKDFIKPANPLIIGVDVWGGDCFINHHTFKICDRTYAVVDQDKFVNGDQIDGNFLTGDGLYKKWGDKLYKYGSSGSGNSNIALPIGLKGVAQFVQVFLESEYNGGVMDIDVLKQKASFGKTPILNIESKDNILVPLTYRYNINLSKWNDQKVYLPKPEYSFEQDIFPSRILYSDIKVYNSDIQGFDVFRVLNFYDLEEDKESLTKLAVAGDALYAIQRQGIKYLPTGQSQLEQTDAGTISVGTSDVIGRAITVDNSRGSQHIGSVVETGSDIFIADNFNKAVYILNREGLQPISSARNSSLFRQLFAGNLTENLLRGIYDPVRNQYWLFYSNFCHIFNEAGMWVANYEFDSKLQGGVYANQNLYLLGRVGSQLTAYTMHTGTPNVLMGTTVVPRVKFVINPGADHSKMFDNMMFIATQRLDSVDMEIEREDSLGTQQVLGMNLDVDSVEGNYRIKTLRDNRTSRLRGIRAIATVKWGDMLSALSAVVTKFRLTRRHPY